jgi:hypothetical protein
MYTGTPEAIMMTPHNVSTGLTIQGKMITKADTTRYRMGMTKFT